MKRQVDIFPAIWELECKRLISTVGRVYNSDRNPTKNAMNSESVSQEMSEWMRSLSVPQRMRALALMYSYITVGTRELFFPQTTSGKEQIVLELLHGVNELHHTLSNSLLRWGHGEEDWTPELLSQQLIEIARQYRIVHLLKSSMEFARTRKT